MCYGQNIDGNPEKKSILYYIILYYIILYCIIYILSYPYTNRLTTIPQGLA